MPIDLSDAECDKIAAAAIARDYTTPPRGTPFDIAVIYRIIVRAGLAAGRARAIEDCATECDELARTSPETREGYADSWSCRNCAAAIRALNAPAAP